MMTQQSRSVLEAPSFSSSTYPVIETTLKGTLNGRPVEGAGSGTLTEEAGELSVVYRLEKFPNLNHATILAAFLITGYPEDCYAIGDPINPFKGLGTIDYKRKLVFSSGEEINFTAACERSPDGLRSKFSIEGNMPEVDKLIGVDNLIETWTPGEYRGEVKGVFPISFLTGKGERIRAVAFTDYQVNKETAPNLDNAEHRHITIQTRTQGRLYFQDQQSTLYGKMPFHRNQFEVLKHRA